MNTKINSLNTLQQTMLRHNVAATIIPSTDPHGSEYVADHWQSREHFSGFTGSAGTLVATQGEAALWTDSRYFIQAEQELKPQGITLMKDGEPETPTIEEWLAERLPKGSVVALDAEIFSTTEFMRLEKFFAERGIEVSAELDLVGEAWQNRPEQPIRDIFMLEVASRMLSDNLKWVRGVMAENSLDGLVLTALDDIAWFLNIRGLDISYNLVAVSYLYITGEEIYLFMDKRKIGENEMEHFKRHKVEVLPYEEFFSFLSEVKQERVGVDLRLANYKIFKSLGSERVVNFTSPVVLEKSQKCRSEYWGFRRAALKDSVAFVRFFMWLEKAMRNRLQLTECSIAEKLRWFRAQDEEYICDSFATISAYGENSAIVHYEPQSDSCAEIEYDKFNRLLLLDSGAHYYCGTTDITRTILVSRTIGPLQRVDYTLVLKGLIALSEANFPLGTRGVQLDVLARQFLWQDNKRYLHGTGHGIGYCLCVHEGPQSIRLQENPQPLLKNMILSNEPAVYYPGKWGIRLENMMMVVDSKKKRQLFGDFYAFETLTYVPFNMRCIKTSMLTDSEIKWLNNYHKECYKRIAPHLTDKEQVWLKKRTQPITRKKG